MNNSIASYERFAPLVARLFIAIQFGVAVYFKLTMFSGQVAVTAAAGVPLATAAVAAALALEVAGIIALLTGYKLRFIAFLLAGYVMLLGIIFYHNWSDVMAFGMFISHLGLSAALLLISVYGTRSIATQTDAA